MLLADIDIEAARRARRTLDVTGHYARPDIFSLSVNRKPIPPVTFSD
jgi:nitrilase